MRPHLYFLSFLKLPDAHFLVEAAAHLRGSMFRPSQTSHHSERHAQGKQTQQAKAVESACNDAAEQDALHAGNTCTGRLQGLQHRVAVLLRGMSCQDRGQAVQESQDVV